MDLIPVHFPVKFRARQSLLVMVMVMLMVMLMPMVMLMVMVMLILMLIPDAEANSPKLPPYAVSPFVLSNCQT